MRYDDGYLTLATAPAAEPIDADDLKLHSRIDGSAEDDLLDSLIVAARQLTERVADVALITQTLTWTMTAWPHAYEIHLPRSPIQSITSIAYTDPNGDAQTVDTEDYTLQVARSRISLVESATWPDIEPRTLIVVTYVAGYGAAGTDVPDRYLHALRILCAHWYEHREAYNDRSLYHVGLGYYSLIGI